PGMSGVDATRKIMAEAPLAILVLSGHAPRGSERAVAALAAGALDAIAKSEVRLTEPDNASAIAMRRRVKRLARTRMKPRSHAHARNGRRSELAGRTASAIGICSSTGGPPALESLLSCLPADYPMPLLVVQHIAPGFLDGLIRWLDGQIALPARIATDGAPLQAGVTFAADGAHLTVERDHLRFDRVTPGRPHRPAGDVLLRSMAAELGAQAAAVVLTGMGEDGALGLGDVAAAGGPTLAQDEESSAVYGMPRAAAEHGAQIISSPQELGITLAALRNGRTP
ncbi:MAG: chemotaxis protein CheB, partial [Solirubrobacteraceae bacterium]